MGDGNYFENLVFVRQEQGNGFIAKKGLSMNFKHNVKCLKLTLRNIIQMKLQN